MPMEGTFKTKSGTKAGTQSLPTPMPMSTDPSTHAEIDGPPDYKEQVNGILPGYSGHMPRARDKYAGSAQGGIAPKTGPHTSIGPQTGHVRPEDVIPPHFDAYMRSQQGTMAGYTGHRPESGHVKNVSAWGAIPHARGLGSEVPEVGLNAQMGSLADPRKPPIGHQGNREYDWRRKNKQQAAPPSFRDNVGGVLPGYAGHVPRAVEKHGESHYGGLAPDKMYVPLAQTGHEGYKIDPMSGQAGENGDVELKMIPNYQGFIPKARDAFAQTHYTKGK